MQSAAGGRINASGTELTYLFAIHRSLNSLSLKPSLVIKWAPSDGALAPTSLLETLDREVFPKLVGKAAGTFNEAESSKKIREDRRERDYGKVSKLAQKNNRGRANVDLINLLVDPASETRKSFERLQRYLKGIREFTANNAAVSDLVLDSDVWAVINGQDSQLLVESKAKHPGLSGALDLVFHAKFDLADAATLPKDVQGVVSIILQAKKGLIYKLVQDSGYPVTSQLIQSMAELMMLRSFGKSAESTGEFVFVDFNRLLFHLIEAGCAGGSKRLNKSEEILFAAIEEDLDVRVKLPDGRTVPPLLGSNSVTQAANWARFQYIVETAYSQVHYLSYVDYTRCICMLESWNTPLVGIRRFIRTFMGALARVDEDIESQLKGGRSAQRSDYFNLSISNVDTLTGAVGRFGDYFSLAERAEITAMFHASAANARSSMFDVKSYDEMGAPIVAPAARKPKVKKGLAGRRGKASGGGGGASESSDEDRPATRSQRQRKRKKDKLRRQSEEAAGSTPVKKKKDVPSAQDRLKPLPILDARAASHIRLPRDVSEFLNSKRLREVNIQERVDLRSEARKGTNPLSWDGGAWADCFPFVREAWARTIAYGPEGAFEQFKEGPERDLAQNCLRGRIFPGKCKRPDCKYTHGTAILPAETRQRILELAVSLAQQAGVKSGEEEDEDIE